MVICKVGISTFKIAKHNISTTMLISNVKDAVCMFKVMLKTGRLCLK